MFRNSWSATVFYVWKWCRGNQSGRYLDQWYNFFVSPYSFCEDTDPVQRDILLTGSTRVENKKESSFHLHQKKMSKLIWAFLQVEGCRYCPVDTAAQGTHTDTCCELLKLVTSGSKLSVSSCLLRNFMLLRPVLSLRNRIKDIHLKIGHRKKVKESSQLTGQDQTGLGTSRLVSFPPPSDCLFSKSRPGWNPLHSSQVGKWKLVFPHMFLSWIPQTARVAPQSISGLAMTRNRPHQILPAWMCLCFTELCCSPGPPPAQNFSPEIETASGCCNKDNFLLGDRDGKGSSPAFETCTVSGTNAHFISPWKITSHSLKCETAASCSSKDK